MKLTIIADDSAVGINGVFYAPINLAQLDPTIHAVQWYEEYGEIEYKTRFENGILVRPANVLITNVTPYQFAVDAWDAAKTEAAAAETATMTEQVNLSQLSAGHNKTDSSAG